MFYLKGKQIDEIAIDFDGVLVDLVGAVIKLVNRKYGYKLKCSDWVSYNPYDSFGKDIGDLMVKSFIDQELYRQAELMPGAYDLMRYVEGIKGVDSYIWTLCNCESIVEKKIEFIERNLECIKRNKKIKCITPVGNNKPYKNIRGIFIDDSYDNLMRSDAYIKIMPETIYNKNKSDRSILKVKGLSEVIELLESGKFY